MVERRARVTADEERVLHVMKYKDRSDMTIRTACKRSESVFLKSVYLRFTKMAKLAANLYDTIRYERRV